MEAALDVVLVVPVVLDEVRVVRVVLDVVPVVLAVALVDHVEDLVVGAHF